MTALAGWQNFYVIVGSSAGALIGLQFVVMTLISDLPARRGGAEEAGQAFATPTVMYFGTVLLLSAVLSAPWNGIAPAAAIYGLIGSIGVLYAMIVGRRMRTQTVYKPVFEDWLFHVFLPLAAYAALAMSAYEALVHVREALFATAAAALLLLFIGIHNAWDGVTYHVFHTKPKQEGVKPID